jgi:WD40 repeat protein
MVFSVAFSPDGKTALSGSYDHTVRLWDLATGAELRTFEGHTEAILSVAFSPDGKTALSGGQDKAIRLWDLATGREIWSYKGYKEWVTSVAFSADGKTALSGSDDKTLRLWDLARGAEIRKFTGHTAGVYSVAFLPDGKMALTGGRDGTLRLWDLGSGREIRKIGGKLGNVMSLAVTRDGKAALSANMDRTVTLWDLATGSEIRRFEGHSDWINSVAFSPDGKSALTGNGKWTGEGDNTIRVWDLTAGRAVRTLKGHSEAVSGIAPSPDGKTVLSGGLDKTVRLWDLSSGLEIRKFKRRSEWVHAVAFSPDGKTVLSGGCEQRGKEGGCDKGAITLWDAATGREIRTCKGHTDRVLEVAFAPGGKTALSGGNFDSTLRLWDLANCRTIREFEMPMSTSVAFSPDGRVALSGSENNGLSVWDLATGEKVRDLDGHSGGVTSVAVSPDSKTALSGSYDLTLRQWDLATGAEIRRFDGHSGGILSVAISPDGKTALSGGRDGMLRLWDLRNGEALASLMESRDGGQLAMTAKGFFMSTRRDPDMLAIARGLEVATIGQVHQSLFNPDLVRDALAGDPRGEVARAALAVNLEKVLDSGPAPQAEIVSHPASSTSDSDLVTVTARIADRGKGIGRIEWRINGITAGVSNAPAGVGKVYEVSQELALDPGNNAVEVVAYNASNMLASPPARTAIANTGPADGTKPKLHILAIGINAYTGAPKLSLAVLDAKSFAAEMQKAGAGMYSEVLARTVLDADAAAKGLERAVQEFAAGIGPRDTAVVFAAAHGISESGRFYLIPQDYPGGTEAQTLRRHAIGQEQLQDWIANKIKAKKVLILLDTCESGALTNGFPASEAGMGRLHEATGRPVLTAAASGQYAHEGVIGASGERHGVFTWAVLDALRNGDANGDGLIELSEIVDHVQKVVPGLAHGLARAVTSAELVFGVQTPRFGSTGEDFAVVRKLQ